MLINGQEVEKPLKSVICKKGHVFTTTQRMEDNCKYKYCTLCGEELFESCPNCNKEIPGGKMFYHRIYSSKGETEYIKEFPLSSEKLPRYCPYCGKAYPWTENFLKEYQQVLDLYSDEIDTKLRETIFNSTQGFLKDNFSKDSKHILFLKKAFSGISKIARDAIVTVLANFAGEAIKNFLK